MPDNTDKIAKRTYWIGVAQYLYNDVFAKMALDLEQEGQPIAAAKIKLCYSLMDEVYRMLYDSWGDEIAQATGKKLVEILLDAMKSAREKMKANKN